MTTEYIVVVKKQLLLWLLQSHSPPWYSWCISRFTNKPLPFINFEQNFHPPSHNEVITFTNNEVISFSKLFFVLFSLKRTDNHTQKSVYVALLILFILQKRFVLASAKDLCRLNKNANEVIRKCSTHSFRIASGTLKLCSITFPSFTVWWWKEGINFISLQAFSVTKQLVMFDSHLLGWLIFTDSREI